MEPSRVTARVFRAVQTVDVNALANVSDNELRPVLAALVRMSLIASLDKSTGCLEGRTAVLRVLSRVELVNNLVALLSIDFHALETDVRKEVALKAKVGGGGSSESVLISNLSLGPALEFERSDATRRLRLVLSELLAIMGQIQSAKEEGNGSNNGGAGHFSTKSSELFDHLVYLSEVCDVLAIAMAELPNLLSPPEVAEALLRLKYGPYIICHMVANQPDSFSDVANHLLKNGDKQDDHHCNKVRHKALLLMCQMHPSQGLYIRNRCIELCRMPSLAVALTLEQPAYSNIVSFMSGLLLGADPQVRSWISIYVRNGQKKRNDSLLNLRAKLLERLADLVKEAKMHQQRSGAITQHVVVRASAILRLYTALRGIAGLKLSEDEIRHLLELIICQPPVSAAGVKFVSLGLCMLIACNSLTSSPELEKRAVDWIRWLVQEEAHFERAASASFGEMLLLMAIHFHSNQLNAIIDLVCQTLGMKIVVRTTSMSKIKHVFTHEIFTEQVVAAHAVRVPVTHNLSANTQGFLPVHCIHQLLKSRAFSKHKVPIKDWIYRQICASTSPLHPVLPSLIEVFVNSVLVPAGSSSARLGPDQTNEPISEFEIRAIFRHNPASLEAASRSRESTPFKLFQTPISSPASSVGGKDHGGSLTAQILMLYYVLLFENVRLAHMKTILTTGRKVQRHSHDLLAELPIKYLLQTAEMDQEKFGGIFPQLLRLCSTHFPHLCLVQDSLLSDEAVGDNGNKEVVVVKYEAADEQPPVSAAQVKEAVANLKSCPAKLTLVIQKLLKMPAAEGWTFAELIVGKVKQILEPDTPSQIRELFGRLWFHLNSVFPRKLWTMTVNHMNHVANGHINHKTIKRITQDDLTIDPLQVLRCDKRVFRCAPMLEIVLYILKACLAASRTMLTQHIQDNPIIERTPSSQVSNELEREELKNALIATQESAAVQILLEAGLTSVEDGNNVKEMRLVCSYLHESFIADPNLAKLVHFQGYPLELLPLTVPGVPSMHICLDFAPELLSQPDLEKQAFAVDLVSHLSVQYALPKSYSTARLAINALSTLLSVLSSEERAVLFPPVLPSMVRFCKAFPPLMEDVVSLLLQYGRICASEACLRPLAGSPRNYDMTGVDDKATLVNGIKEVKSVLDSLPTNDPLSHKIYDTFAAILDSSVLEKRLY